MAEDTQPVDSKLTEQTTANPSDGTQKAETPADVMIPKARFDEVNKKLRDLEAAATAQQKAAAKADEERMATQNEWQKLAETRKAAIDELTGFAELATKLSEMSAAQYEADIKDWPEQVKAMAPDDDADILTKLAWMQKAKPLALELLKDKAPVPGNGPRPKVAAALGSKPAAVENIIDVRRSF